MKTGICIWICAAMLVMLSSCGNGGPGAESSSRPAGASENAVIIASGGKGEYVIVRGENAEEYEKSATAFLKTAIAEGTGVSLEAEDDWIREGASVEETRADREILIGQTNRPESKEAEALLASRGGNDAKRFYVIKDCGKAIVLMGETPYGTYLAAEYFAAHYIDKEEKTAAVSEKLEYYGEYYPGDEGSVDMIENSGEVFFRPEDGGTGDVTPIYHEGRFYLFFLHSTNHKWCYVTTTDFVTYSEVTVLRDFGGTGDVLYVDGVWHLFASRTENGKEIIHHYTGTDLRDLRDTEKNIASDGKRFVTDAWRDPRVWFDETIGKYRMIVTTNVIDGNSVNRNGCIAFLTSDDLYTWTIGGEFFSPGYYQGSCECPDSFKIGDWYYLVYSDCSYGKRTYYVKSKSPDGPWEIPDRDTFDSLFFYAGKTASNGTDRFIFGWAGDRSPYKLPLNADGSYTSPDFATIRYAGNMVIHKLEQRENGDLVPAPVDSIVSSFPNRVTNTFSALSGDWDTGGTQASVRSPHGFSSCLMQMMPDRFVMTFTVKTDAKQTGLALHVSSAFADDGYFITLDRQYHRLRLISGELSGVGGYYFPYASELESPVEFDAGKEYRITVINEGQIATVYVDGQCALTVRMIATAKLSVGLFCYAGDAEFSDIEMKTR